MPADRSNRETLVHAVRMELVGPAPAGREIDCALPIAFEDAKESYGPWCQRGSGDEILNRDPPTKRYGVGVLYPKGTPLEAKAEEDLSTVAQGFSAPVPAQDGAGVVGADPLTEQARKSLERAEDQLDHAPAESESDDATLSAANAFRPSSMGISFLAEVPEGAELIVRVAGGRYRPLTIRVAGREHTWWLRSTVALVARFVARDLRAPHTVRAVPSTSDPDNAEGIAIEIRAISRPYPAAGNPCRLITVYVANRTPKVGGEDGCCLFQSSLWASVQDGGGGRNILPYPGPPGEQLDDEEASLALLYREMQTYAVGHGCAADWDDGGEGGRVAWACGDSLPACETPSITPDIRRDDGLPIQVPMAPLAGIDPARTGFEMLHEVVDLYSGWIERQRDAIPSLPISLQDAASRHMDDCAHCVERMRNGLSYLRTSEIAQHAFRLANHAILLQQVRSKRERRDAQYDVTQQRMLFSEPYSDPDLHAAPPRRGMWRAFQIAFLLMAMGSAAEPDAPDRETVELIWFPTGGGKTEAYLGLAAFAVFMRRLRDPHDTGVHVLMRYTLRLLTAQQFQRASALVCAMEHLRRQDPARLGPSSISIGMWLGASSTPNSRQVALTNLRDLQKGNHFTENLFILDRCPWCRAQLGPLEYKGRAPKGAPLVLGYKQQGPTVVFACADMRCPFAAGLPISVIDEDIYANPPALLIGTVDKFAQLAWHPPTRALFGIDAAGVRQSSPPGLIIQDELHLISGPLGSMVGLYEAVIEELCTDRRGATPVRPKIVASTATIRRYAAQIRSLYARQEVALFPPPGLDAGDSFFARYAREPDGSLSAGRLYLGVHAPGLGSMQTAQVRTFTALLQAPAGLPVDARDPWWTLLLFFNSLRELGTTLSLFQSDIPDYMRVLANRLGLEPAQMRRFWEILELTGRLSSDEVPKAIRALEVVAGTATGHPVDVCLASNILEVGIDIDRLSVMAIVGQPKTTSTYIQVSGRVGRRWWESPGLVVTIYGASKPRDRSHFEKFRSYHERLYAQVEPTSVTPFSPPALDRALHAIMVAYVRTAGSAEVAECPYPYPRDMLDTLEKILLPRVLLVDPAEVPAFSRVFAGRATEWQDRKRTLYREKADQSDIPLLRHAGAYATRERQWLSWPTPDSMRTVDAECEAVITNLYLHGED